MDMQEMFYGQREPLYFRHFARQDYNPDFQQHPNRRVISTFDLMVPICCRNCENQVRETLSYMEGVHDVMCDRYNQLVTIVGYADPLQCLKRVKQVKKGSKLWNAAVHDKHRR